MLGHKMSTRGELTVLIGYVQCISELPQPLFQSEAKCEAIDIKEFLFKVIQVKLIITRQV